MKHLLLLMVTVGSVLMNSAQVNADESPVNKATDGKTQVNLSADTVRQRLLLQTLAYRSSAEFSLYSLQHGDRKSAQRLDTVLAEGQTLANALKPNWPELAPAWQEMTQFVNDNRALAAKAEDVNFSIRLEENYNKLYAVLDGSIPDTTVLDNETRRILNMLDSLEHIVSAYLFFNINIFGGLSVTDTGIEQQNKLFKALTAELDDAELRTQVERKWGFLESTLLAYNERSAVFIVTRTCDSIRELLLKKLQPEDSAES